MGSDIVALKRIIEINYRSSSHFGTLKVSPKLAHSRWLTKAISDCFISQIGTSSAYPAKLDLNHLICSLLVLMTILRLKSYVNDGDKEFVLSFYKKVFNSHLIPQHFTLPNEHQSSQYLFIHSGFWPSGALRVWEIAQRIFQFLPFWRHNNDVLKKVFFFLSLNWYFHH